MSTIDGVKRPLLRPGPRAGAIRIWRIKRIIWITLAALALLGVTLVPARASTRLAHRAAVRTCWEGPHATGHINPGGACWTGGIAIRGVEDEPNDVSEDYDLYCMGQQRRSGPRVLVLENRCKPGNNWFAVDLVGYVTDQRSGHFWPFRDPSLDHVYAGWAVVNLVFLPDNKVTRDTPINCVQDPVNAENNGAVFGKCSPERQGGRDLDASYFVWKPGHRIEAVHLTNASPGAHAQLWCLFADDPSLGQDVRLLQPIASRVVQAFQYWYEQHIRL